MEILRNKMKSFQETTHLEAASVPKCLLTTSSSNESENAVTFFSFAEGDLNESGSDLVTNR